MKSSPRVEIDRLRKEIASHDYLYYVKAQPTISDLEYDRLFHRLQELEQAHPDLVTPDSPTQRVGDALSEGFRSVRHPFPMISLQNSYDESDLLEFHRRVLEGLEGAEPEYVCEHKFDGVSIILTYEDGFFAMGATRGDGEKGDDVTANLKTIRSLPLSINQQKKGTVIPPLFYVRGEVFMSKADFLVMNEEQAAEGKKPFANPRNSVAGTLKVLDPKIVASRPLSIVCYGMDIPNERSLKTHSQALDWLSDLGFSVSKYWKVCDSIEKVKSYWQEWESKRDQIPYEVDGIVVKVNSLAQQRSLGMTARAPRWALACKFSARQAQTKLNDIVLQIGRTGVITPVADLAPVPLGGVTISRATLHNFEEIKRLDVRIGDTVVLERGGDVIPKVIGVELTKRAPSAKKYVPPKKCPFCKSELEKVEGEVALRCPNPEDSEVVKRQIEHFASRGALDIASLGSETVNQLVDEDLAKDPGDLFFLKKKDLLELEGWAEKSVSLLFKGLEAAKKQPLEKLIFALGIRFVGESTARTLAVRLGNMSALREATAEQLQDLPDVGPRVAKAIEDFFRSNYAKRMLKKLELAGFDFSAASSEPVGDKFSGLTLVLTGGLETITRDEAERMIIAQGGKATSSVSKKTSYVIAGENAGSKLQKALELGVPVLTEAEFIKLLKS